MKKCILFLFGILFQLGLNAQTIKTDVLVVGNGNAAWAAGYQAAVSGVKAVILLQNEAFQFLPMDKNIHSGVEKAFLDRLAKAGTQSVNQLLKTWADSTKKLTLLQKVKYTKIERSGNNWAVKLSDGKTIKAQVLVQASSQDLSNSIKVDSKYVIKSQKLSYNLNVYRTSVASGNVNNGTANFYSMYDLLMPGQENLVLANCDDMFVGQAAGATAAYAAFFKTKTSAANLKVIQGELLNYKAALMPFADITVADSNWRAIQNVGLTGIVKAELKGGVAYFMPDQIVTYSEIKQPIKDFYYKAQIWFDDHKDVAINLENTISLVCYVGNKSVENTKIELEKRWAKMYKFSSKFDLKKELTRREFAVIVNDYLQPFIVNWDKTGRVIR